MNNRAILIMAFLPFLVSLPGGESKNCRGVAHSGTFTFHLGPHCSPCEDYRWKNDGIPVAHEDKKNVDLVLSYGPCNITFKRPPGNVTYSCHQTETQCSYEYKSGNDSNSNSSSGEDPTPSTHLDHTDNNLNIGVIIGYIIGSIVGAVLIVAAGLNKSCFRRYFGTLRRICCRDDYSQANQNPPV